MAGKAGYSRGPGLLHGELAELKQCPQPPPLAASRGKEQSREGLFTGSAPRTTSLHLICQVLHTRTEPVLKAALPQALGTPLSASSQG